MNGSDLEVCIGRGLEYLRRSQLPSGEFKVFMSPDLSLERDCIFDSSPFPTALIAYALGFADPTAASDILDKALRFLLAEMEGPGLWRYWTKRHQSHTTIPPDLDDTACASSALRRHRISYALGFAGPTAAGDILDKALRFLLAEMEGPGGNAT